VDGILNVHKPAGVTSHDVVDFVRRLLGKGSRAGHCGTLDPAASGVLAICLGKATRLAEYLAAGSKEYLATMLLDRRTTTGDLEGETTCVHEPGPAGLPSRETVAAASAGFVGALMQRPHRVSAVRVQGRRLYERVRAGEPDVAVAERPIRIYRLELLDYCWPRLEVAVECSAGTYIRQLAEDLGTALGTGGCLARLVRTRVDSLALEDALTPGDLAGCVVRGELERAVLPPAGLLHGFGEARLLPGAVERVSHGQRLAPEHLASFEAPAGPELVKVLSPDDRLLAIYRPGAGGLLEPCKVLI
jgi:tRNA pseudouridine55 synthase